MKKIFYACCFTLGIFFLFATTIVAAMQNDDKTLYPFSSFQDKERFQLLTNEIRCVVCQNQTIGDSDAALAYDVRKKIYYMVLQKKSNNEIKNYLVKRYGEFILFEPPLQRKTLLLWGFPWIGLIVTPFLIFFYHRKLRLAQT